MYTAICEHQPQMKKKTNISLSNGLGELTIDCLIGTGALSSEIPEMDLRKSQLISPQSVIQEVPPPYRQIRVANGQLENPKGIIELKLEVSENKCVGIQFCSSLICVHTFGTRP